MALRFDVALHNVTSLLHITREKFPVRVLHTSAKHVYTRIRRVPVCVYVCVCCVCAYVSVCASVCVRVSGDVCASVRVCARVTPYSVF